MGVAGKVEGQEEKEEEEDKKEVVKVERRGDEKWRSKRRRVRKWKWSGK